MEPSLYHFSQFAGCHFGAAGTSVGTPASGTEFWQFVCADLGKVFPLLLCPFLAAILLRALLPKVHAKLGQYHELSFYLWAVALTLAIGVTVKSIVHSDVSFWYRFFGLLCPAVLFREKDRTSLR